MRIFLTRHGESIYNTEDRLGGDSSLTEKGSLYSQALSNYRDKCDDFPTVCITSTKMRAIQTAHSIGIDKTYEELDEINAGIGEHMTYSEFAINYPEENKLREENKLTYCYPSGESYIDLIERTRPIITDILKSGKDILIVCHRAVIRVLLYHIINSDIKDVPFFDVPLHKVLKIEDGEISYIDI